MTKPCVTMHENFGSKRFWTRFNADKTLLFIFLFTRSQKTCLAKTNIILIIIFEVSNVLKATMGGGGKWSKKIWLRLFVQFVPNKDGVIIVFSIYVLISMPQTKPTIRYIYCFPLYCFCRPQNKDNSRK